MYYVYTYIYIYVYREREGERDALLQGYGFFYCTLPYYNDGNSDNDDNSNDNTHSDSSNNNSNSNTTNNSDDFQRELRGSQGMGVVSSSWFHRGLHPVIYMFKPSPRKAVHDATTSYI